MNFINQVILIYRVLLQKFFGFAKNIFKKLDGVTAKYYFKTKAQKRVAVILVVSFGLLLFIDPVRAGIDEALVFMLLPLLSAIISILGVLLAFLIWILVKVAQYNGFIDAEPVRIGWQLVRDVCNMFFIIVLLVIAFATVLQIQNYHYKNLLKKLIIMALLINFSKTITAFFIDFSQIIMLTFVSAFKDSARNFTSMLGLEGFLNFTVKSAKGEANINFWSLLGAAIIGLILIIVCCIVVIIFLLILIVRIMYLWLLMVLSPLAYFLSTFPSGQQYASKWWKTFSEQLIIGPLLAFFLWLALASAQVSGGKITLGDVNVENDEINDFQIPGQEEGKAPPVNPFATKAVQPANILATITGISLLIVGLMLAQEMGGAAGKIAGKGLSKLQDAGTGKIGPTPMRWARERIDGYKKAREEKVEKRKEKAAEFGARMYGVTQMPKAAWTGFKQTEAGKKIVSRVKAGAVGTAAVMAGPVGWAAGLGYLGRKQLAGVTGINKISRHRQSIRDHKDGVQEASDNIDLKTGKYKPIEKNGYRYTRKDDGGVKVENLYERDVDGNVQKDSKGKSKRLYERDVKGNIVKDTDGKAVTKQVEILQTSKFGDDFRMGFNRQNSAATTVIGKAAEGRMQRYMSEYEVLSDTELRQVSGDGKAKGEQRRAADMMLVQKDKGFKKQEDLQRAKKEHFGNYPTLIKKFDEMADKKYALWNNTEDQLQTKMADGRVDAKTQSTATLDKTSIAILSKVLGYKFKDALKSMNRTTNDQDNLKKALQETFAKEYHPDDKEDTKMRNAYNAVTADVMGASTYEKGGIEPARLDAMVVEAKSESLANIDDELLNTINPNSEAEAFQKSFVHNTSRAQLKGLQRSGLAPDKLIKYIQLLEEKAASDPKVNSILKEIEEDKELKSLVKRGSKKNRGDDEMND